MNELEKVWKDQEEFNRYFFPKPDGFDEQSRQSKEYVLCVISECNELLNACQWKIHRRNKGFPNPEQVKNELTDILKYWISLCITWNVSPAEAIADYWRKSMVVRQRYSEEFVLNLEGKIVLCDIDGVLADYCQGLLAWVVERYPNLADKARSLFGKNVWLNASTLEVHEQVWQELKHDFRTSRGKVSIPAYEGAEDFLNWCREMKGYKVVLLTSRPIDKYPNIYTDTLEWLQTNHLNFDFIWWAVDKGEMILSKNITHKTVFAVDDDLKYIERYKQLGIPCYHITPSMTVKDLHDRLRKEVV